MDSERSNKSSGPDSSSAIDREIIESTLVTLLRMKDDFAFTVLSILSDVVKDPESSWGQFIAKDGNISILLSYLYSRWDEDQLAISQELSYIKTLVGNDGDYSKILQYLDKPLIHKCSRIAKILLLAEDLGLDLNIDAAEKFTNNHSDAELEIRFRKIREWLTSVNMQNGDGVTLTPLLIDYLFKNEEINKLLEEIDLRRKATLCGKFDLTDSIQRDLEFNRFWYEYHYLDNAPPNKLDLYPAFLSLKTFPKKLPAYEFKLSNEQQRQSRRAGFEAACFLQFVIKLRANSSRSIVVVGNDRYGRQWVVEPNSDRLKAEGISVRYDRVQSHKSYRFSVPHRTDRHTREGFPLEFVQELSTNMPHVIIVDARSPHRGKGMMRISRASRDYVNWFAVFNDIRASGDDSKYKTQSSLPDHLGEFKKWHRFQSVRAQIESVVDPGETYSVTHWAPILRENVLLGDFVVPFRDPFQHPESPKVIVANTSLYDDGDFLLPEFLDDTEPYYFSDPEKHVKDEFELGFGTHGIETRLVGPTMDMFIRTAQLAIASEIEILLQGKVLPQDGVVFRDLET